MNTLRYISLGLLVFVVNASGALCRYRATFDLDYSLFKATDIILVTEGEVIDGCLKVLKSWKGNLKPDMEIVIPELAEFAWYLLKATDSMVTAVVTYMCFQSPSGFGLELDINPEDSWNISARGIIPTELWSSQIKTDWIRTEAIFFDNSIQIGNTLDNFHETGWHTYTDAPERIHIDTKLFLADSESFATFFKTYLNMHYFDWPEGQNEVNSQLNSANMVVQFDAAARRD